MLPLAFDAAAAALICACPFWGIEGQPSAGFWGGCLGFCVDVDPTGAAAAALSLLLLLLLLQPPSRACSGGPAVPVKS